VRSLPTMMEKFKDCIELKNIKCVKMMCLDVQTRWNSMLLMLTTTKKYKKLLTFE
jgi:hypothetical protein